MRHWVHSTALITLLAASSVISVAIRAEVGDHGHAVGEDRSHRNPDLYDQMSDTMHHMAGQIKSMSEMTTQGNMDLAMHKQIAERMLTMSMMVDHMASMIGKVMTTSAGMQQMMSEMSKQMDDMVRQPLSVLE